MATLTRQQALKKVDILSDLPTLPTFALEVNRLLQDYESPLELLTEMLEKDQSLVVRILRLVNSSFFGFRGRVQNVRHAVALLGYNTVRNAVMTVAVFDLIGSKKLLKGYDIADLWKHSIQVAATTRFFAAMLQSSATEDAFVAGLLHDIGKIITAKIFPAAFVDILEAQKGESMTFRDAENKLQYCSHTVIGGHLAKRWMLPDTLIEAIRNHHASCDQALCTELCLLVKSADSFVHIMNGRNAYHLPMDEMPSSISEKLSHFLRDINAWYPRLKKQIEEACILLQ